MNVNVNAKMKESLLMVMEDLRDLTDKDDKKYSKDEIKAKIESARELVNTARAIVEIERAEIDQQKQMINSLNAIANLKRAGFDENKTLNLILNNNDQVLSLK